MPAPLAATTSARNLQDDGLHRLYLLASLPRVSKQLSNSVEDCDPFGAETPPSDLPLSNTS